MILGIDVSHYEPSVDWIRAKAHGVAWMYTKATEGVSHTDLMLRTHIAQAQAAGVLVGAYHFFHCGQAGGVQAEHFLNKIAGLKLDLPPCLDWESGSADGVEPDKQVLMAKGFLNTVVSETGRTPIIYGGESYLRSLPLDPSLGKYPLWLAHYGVGQTGLHVPKPWANWTMWQYTDAETIQGLASGHHVDASWFNGSMDELKSLTRS